MAYGYRAKIHRTRRFETDRGNDQGETDCAPAGRAVRSAGRRPVLMSQEIKENDHERSRLSQLRPCPLHLRVRPQPAGRRLTAVVRRQPKGPVQRATGSFWTWVMIACAVYLWSKGQA